MFWKKKKVAEPETKNTENKDNGISPDAFLFSHSHDLGYSFDSLHSWNKDNAIQHVPSSFAMDSDMQNVYNPTFERVNQNLLNYYVTTSSFIGYQALAIIGQHWLVNKGCYQKVRDAMKRGYEIVLNNGKVLTPEQLQEIKKEDKNKRLHQNIIEAVGMNNIFGVRHIMFKHKNPNFNYERPFNEDSFKDGNYAGIAQIDPYWTAPILREEDMRDPTSISFYTPEFWLVQGKKIHKSHMIVLKGEDVADLLKPTYRYGGLSMCQRIYERVYCAERTANESPQLVMTKRLNARKVDLAKAIANREGFIKNMKEANKYRDNHGWLVYGKDEEIVQLETNLSQLSDVINNQYEIVSSILDVPVSKLLGTGHKGLGTGETDDDYYISSLEAMQRDILEMIMMEHYKRLLPSIFGEMKDIEISWNSLKVMSEKEVADMNYVKSQTALNEFNIGSIDAFDERERLIQEKHSQYHGIESKSAEELEPDPEELGYITPDNRNNGGANNTKNVNGKQQKNPKQNSTK